MAEQAWERIVERNRTAEALPRLTYAPSEERLRSIGADLDADKGQLDKVQRQAVADRKRITALEAHVDWLQKEIGAVVERLVAYETAEAWVEQAIVPAEERA